MCQALLEVSNELLRLAAAQSRGVRSEDSIASRSSASSVAPFASQLTAMYLDALRSSPQSSPSLFALASEGAAVLLTLRLPAAGDDSTSASLSSAVVEWLSVWGSSTATPAVAASALRALAVVACRHPALVIERALPTLLHAATLSPPPSGMAASSSSPTARRAGMAAVTSLALAHPDVLACVLPDLLGRLQLLLPLAFSSSPQPHGVDELGLLLSALSHLIAHYSHTTPQASPTSSSPSPSLPPPPGLPSSLLLDLALFLLGLLYASAVQSGGEAARDGGGRALDERVLGCLLTATPRIAAALSSSQQRALLASLLPALITGPAEALLTAYQQAALRLTGGTVSSSSSTPLQLSTSVLSRAPPLLRRGSSLAVRQLLSVFACVLCAARVDVTEWLLRPLPDPQSPVVVDRLLDFVRQPSSAAAPWDGADAVLHCIASLLNKAPAGHPQLQRLLDRVLLPALVELEEDGAVVSSPQATDERLSLLCLSIRALSMRAHPISALLLTRYLQLPSRPSSALRRFPSSLRVWASGFALLLGELPFLLTRHAHCRQGVGSLHKQRSLALALPALLEQVQEGRERMRKTREGGQTEDDGGEWTQLTAALLALLHLLSSVPLSLVPSSSRAAVVSGLQLAMASPSPDCRRLALSTLHHQLEQGMNAQLLVDHASSLLPFLLASVGGVREAQAGVQGHESNAGSPDDEVDVVRALAVLSALCDSLPYSALYPHRLAVLKGLSAAVDHPSRRVRRAAISVKTKMNEKT